MPEFDDNSDSDLIPQPQDRRLQSLVHDLEKKVGAIEIGIATRDARDIVVISGLRNELDTLRQSAATSFEVKAASELTNVKLDNLRGDLSAMKSIMIWTAGIILAGVLGAGLKLILVDNPREYYQQQQQQQGPRQ